MLNLRLLCYGGSIRSALYPNNQLSLPEIVELADNNLFNVLCNN